MAQNPYSPLKYRKMKSTASSFNLKKIKKNKRFSTQNKKHNNINPSTVKLTLDQLKIPSPIRENLQRERVALKNNKKFTLVEYKDKIQIGQKNDNKKRFELKIKDNKKPVMKKKDYKEIFPKENNIEEPIPNLIKIKSLKTITLKPKENGHHNKYASTCGNDSSKLGAKKFNWVIYPVKKDKFFLHYWEKQPLYVQRQDKNYYHGLLSTEIINKILKTKNVQFTKNLDLASYRNGKRETHNPEGRALPSVVWDYFNTGCSIRMLNPQTFHKPVWKLLATLQEYFQSFCGANVYLTPPGTQGFAPHWDDIEAFILQLEGKKRWKVYSPRSEKETLPRESSKNFGPKDNLGTLILDVTLEPGDLLYFPRGYIHQGEALEDTHSLHITFSTYQKTSWFDFLEKLLPATLVKAAEENVEFRRGLPIGYANAGGIALSEIKSVMKVNMKQKVHELVSKMMEYAPFDSAIDQMVKGFVYDSLPPVLEKDEMACSIFGGGESWNKSLQKVVNRVELAPDTAIRFLRRGCVRTVLEEDSVQLFHSVENSREYHAEEPKYVEVDSEMAIAIDMLVQSYPKFVKIEDLPLETLEDKLILASGLWEKGLITTDEPLFNDFED